MKLSRLLKGCDVKDLTKTRARAVGALATRAHHDDIVDVSVVEGALRHHAVVTSNASHIRRVAAAADANLTIRSI